MSQEVHEEEKNKVEKPSLLGMITDPRTQLERIRYNPKILVAFIIVTLLTVVGMVLLMFQVDFIGDDPLLNDMGEEELMFVTIVSQVVFVVVGLFTPAVAILINALVYFIVAKIISATVTFKQLFSMTLYIYIISVLGLIINGLAFVVTGNADPDLLLTSLNSIVGAEGALGAVLNAIEIFAIWGYIVTALGLQIVARFSKGLSWGIVIGIFVVMVLFNVGSQVVTGMAGAL